VHHPDHPLAEAVQHPVLLVALTAVELRGAHQQQAGDDREEAGRVDGEADGHAQGGDEDPSQGRPRRPCKVKERGVQRHRVGQLLPAHHLEHEGLSGRHVDDLHRTADRGQEKDLQYRRLPGQGEKGEGDGGQHQGGLGGDDRGALVEAVHERSAQQPKDGVGQELEGRERPQGERGPGRGVGELDDHPCLSDVLNPGSGDRDRLPGEEEPVVAVALEAAEGAG